MPRPEDSFNYPVYPGTDEWASLMSGTERTAVCQVPECILRKMSTQAVIQAIWEMPLCGNSLIVLLGYFQNAIESDIRRYNSFEELTKREDAGPALLERLTVVDPLTFIPHESSVLELLLSRDVFLSQLNESEMRRTVEISLINDDIRTAAWDAGTRQYAQPATWILIGKTMFAAGYEPFMKAVNENEQLKDFIDGWMPDYYDPNKRISYFYIESVYGNIPQLIIDYSKDYIND